MGKVKITILSETEKMRGTSFPLVNDQYTLGRSESADICIPDPTISGHHCTLLKTEDESYAVRDENSTNGTRVNGEKVETEIIPLKNGDILQVGGVEILFDNGEERHTEVHTMTVINLEETGTISMTQAQMKNLGNASSNHSRSLRDNRKHNAIIYGIVGVLALLALGAIAYLCVSMLGGSHTPTP
ncbi:MAG: FHA domain-containing protein [Victivallales bacterium]|nr:FHA domain-containing protein [Victivallales bacterium]